MTKEEIKEELLKNDQEQTNIIINAQFMALYTQLVKKGVLYKKDINEMNKFTEEYIDKINNKLTDEIFERIKEESNE
jgi:hypothetical protein